MQCSMMMMPRLDKVGGCRRGAPQKECRNTRGRRGLFSERKKQKAGDLRAETDQSGPQPVPSRPGARIPAQGLQQHTALKARILV